MERSGSGWPWPDDEPSTGDLRDRLAASRQWLVGQMITTLEQRIAAMGEQ